MAEPTAPPSGLRVYPRLDGGNSFRLAEVSNIRRDLQNEASKRARSRQRYKKAYLASYAVNTGACAASSLATAGAIGTLTTGVGAIASLPLGIAALTAGVVGLTASAAQKILLKKLEKHERILALTEAKLSTVDRMVSYALKNDDISSEEFDAIQKEMSDFRVKKRDVQVKVRSSAGTDIDRLKKELIEKLNERQ